MCPPLCVYFFSIMFYIAISDLYLSSATLYIYLIQAKWYYNVCLIVRRSFVHFFFLFICSFVCLFFVYLFVCFFVNLVCDFVCLFMIWSQQQNSYQLIQSRPQIQLKNILGKAIRDKWENPENDHLSFRSSRRPTNQLAAMIVHDSHAQGWGKKFQAAHSNPTDNAAVIKGRAAKNPH